MKKVLLLVSVLLIATSVFAAPAKKPSAPVPAVSQSQSNSGSMFSAISLNTNGCPAVRMSLGSMVFDLGGSLASAAGTTTVTLFVKGDNSLGQIGAVRTYWAPQLMLFSNAGATTTTLSLLFGGEYIFASNLSIFADLTALSLTSAAGATTWNAGANGGLVYSGLRLYL
ncbi:MAG: hypothetical protein WCV91_06770 [Candidatus Margulisiibacteriota bacterium]|jgi:hypothetical protein